jgi:hypothetical protein
MILKKKGLITLRPSAKPLGTVSHSSPLGETFFFNHYIIIIIIIIIIMYIHIVSLLASLWAASATARHSANFFF